LYWRAGFGANAGELERALRDGPEASLDRLLAPSADAGQFEATQNEFETAAARAGDVDAWDAWWLRRLRETPDPFGERLALLWHGHFAIGAGSVGDVALFHRHVAGLRRASAGTLRGLMGTLLEDPAVYVALGGSQNRRARPSLTFGRTWIEGLATGAGAAAEGEIRDVARAFTGWFAYGGTLRFIDREHDGGDKRILGRAGTFGRDDLESVLGDHPGTARRLAVRVFREFITAATPPDGLIEVLASRLRAAGTLREAVAMVLRSNLFFSAHAVGQRIKTPVELAVGLTRALGTLPPGATLVRDLARLGQRLSDPPTVAGWPSGVDWINTLTAPGRLRLCEALVKGGGGYGAAPDLGAGVRAFGSAPVGQRARRWLDVLMPEVLAPAVREGILGQAPSEVGNPEALRRWVRGLVCRPEFQLT
jgi:uncharacterized protein (DUF1800 family)